MRGVLGRWGSEGRGLLSAIRGERTRRSEEDAVPPALILPPKSAPLPTPHPPWPDPHRPPSHPSEQHQSGRAPPHPCDMQLGLVDPCCITNFRERRCMAPVVEEKGEGDPKSHGKKVREGGRQVGGGSGSGMWSALPGVARGMRRTFRHSWTWHGA